MSPVGAIIPAAGLSSRLSGFKPLLPLGDQVAVERLVEMFKAAGIGPVCIVCGHRAQELEPVVRAAGAVPVINPDFRRGMFSSVQAGVRELDSRCQAFFLLPVDVMLVRPDTLRRLLLARERDPGRVLHPVFKARRGHPPLIPANLKDEILAWQGRGGLAGYLAEHESTAPGAALEVPVADEFIHFDVDTDQDYEQALSRLENYDLPSRAECLALLDIEPNVNEMGRRHSKAVAGVAQQIARALNISRSPGRHLNPRLVEAAGLLHDIAKGFDHHEQEGGRMLSEMGYERVGRVVAAHRDIDPHENEPVAERAVVYFADKLVRGDRLVSVEERFKAKMDEYEHVPGAVEAIRGRMVRALKVKAMIEAEIGAPLDAVVRGDVLPETGGGR